MCENKCTIVTLGLGNFISYAERKKGFLNSISKMRLRVWTESSVVPTSCLFNARTIAVRW